LEWEKNLKENNDQSIKEEKCYGSQTETLLHLTLLRNFNFSKKVKSDFQTLKGLGFKKTCGSMKELKLHFISKEKSLNAIMNIIPIDWLSKKNLLS
jgi:hypothetical protein